MATPKKPIIDPDVPVPTKLDPTVLAAAQRANRGTVAAKRAVLAAEAAAEAAEAAAAEAARLNGSLQRRPVVINARTQNRPRLKFTPQAQQQYLELLRKAVTPPHAAQAVGVATRTIKDIMRADPEFGEAVKQARADATAPIVEAMWDLALSGSFAAQKYLLENMAPEDWKDPKNIKVEVTGQIESTGPEDRAGQIERIRRLEERLTERLALRAAGDQIEEEMLEDAELVDQDDTGQIEGAE